MEKPIPPPSAPQFASKNVAPQQELPFLYRGIEIKGINSLEQNGILLRQEVSGLLDRLPNKYFDQIPLGVISFEPYELYSVERGGKIIYVKGDELQAPDNVIARKRGKTSWNSEMNHQGIAVPTDGKMAISVFSVLNWDHKNDKQLDKDTALYTLAHELGHTIWGAASYIPGIFGELKKMGISLPCSEDAVRLLPFIDQWKLLTESQLKRYQEYKDIFSREHKSDKVGLLERSLGDLGMEEDFAISHEYFLYWQNLQQLDSERQTILQTIHDKINSV